MPHNTGCNARHHASRTPQQSRVKPALLQRHVVSEAVERVLQELHPQLQQSAAEAKDLRTVLAAVTAKVESIQKNILSLSGEAPPPFATSGRKGVHVVVTRELTVCGWEWAREQGVPTFATELPPGHS